MSEPKSVYTEQYQENINIFYVFLTVAVITLRDESLASSC